MNLWKNKNFTPMLLEEIKKPFNSVDHIFEIKFDGIRALIFVSPKEIYIQSRNKKDLTPIFPELENIKKLVKNPTIFDGEIVLFCNGLPSFSELLRRLHLKNTNNIHTSSIENPVVFIAFDILYEKKDLTSLTLLERKKHLSFYKDTDYFTKIKYIDKDGIKLFKSVKKLKLEGIVAKNKTSKYYINKRTEDFIKIKNIQRSSFIIGGYEKKKNDILSLSLGEYVDNSLNYVGKVSINKKAKIYNKILKMKKTKNHFTDYNENINYIKPNLSCTVEYLEKTKNNHLRHPIYKNI